MLTRPHLIRFCAGVAIAFAAPLAAQEIQPQLREEYNVCWGQDEKQCTDRSVAQRFFPCGTGGHHGYSSEYVCQTLCSKPNKTGSCETWIRYGRGGGQCGYIWTHVHCY